MGRTANAWWLPLLLALSAACARPPAVPASPPKAASLARPALVDRVAVPGGILWMGCNDAIDAECGNDEHPRHLVRVGRFLMDRTEVTVEAFRRCVESGACTPAPGLGECNYDEPGRDPFAVNCVTWYQARAYCEWSGGRLPSEAEWEFAARGLDGRKYPWGNEAPDAGAVHRANYGEGLVPDLWMRDGWTYDAPVGRFPLGASPYGLLDAAGNLGEWVLDVYADRYEGPPPPSPLPRDARRVIRGGSWRDYIRRIRTSARDAHEPGRWFTTVGFRCAAGE